MTNPVFGKTVGERGFVLGSLEGWRFWSVEPQPTPHLISAFQRTHWPAGDLVANGPVTQQTTHGFYAFKDPKHLLEYCNEWGLVAIGRVALWGDIIEGEIGYRAQYARITALETMLVRSKPKVGSLRMGNEFYYVPRNGTNPVYMDEHPLLEPLRKLYL